MLHRTMVLLVMAWSLAILMVPATGSHAATDPTGVLSLRLQDIPEMARAQSPRAQVLTDRLAAVSADRQTALQWSNPALAYDHEEFDTAREWQLTLHKRLDRPLGRGALDKAWDGRIRAQELQNDQQLRDLAAELKGGYVHLQLLENRLQRLDRLAQLVALTAEAAAHRHHEGELSGLDRQLIQLATYSLTAERLRLQGEHRSLLVRWRADLGLAPDRPVRLTTPVTFRPVALDSLDRYRQQLEAAPGLQFQSTLADALDRQAAAARPGLLPGLDIYGGFKRFAAEGDGFVAGVALDLPVFDRGQGPAARLTAERRIVLSELAADRLRRRGEVAALTTSLQQMQPALADFHRQLTDTPLAETLLLSFREGAMTLDELLGAVQIEAAALAGYHDSLADYYRNIFRLEALTGAEVVDLAP